MRKEKPYQLADDLERLFQKRAMTGRAGWSRLFSETMTALRFEMGGKRRAAGADAQRPRRSRPTARRKAAETLTKVFKANVRLFTLITNILAKDKEISDRCAASRTSPPRATSPTMSSPRSSKRWSRRSASNIRGFRIAITR